MAKNITQKDIERLVRAIATETRGKDTKGYIVRSERHSGAFDRWQELGLIEHAEIEGSRIWGYRPSQKAMEHIQPILDERKHKQAESDARSLAFALEQNARDEAFKAELVAAGVTLFDHARADKSWRGDGKIEYSVGFPITCRIEYDSRANRYFIRAAVGHSGECDPDALIEETKQAKIARDLLNAKLHLADFNATQQAIVLRSLRDTGTIPPSNVVSVSSRKLDYLREHGLLGEGWKVTELGLKFITEAAQS